METPNSIIQGKDISYNRIMLENKKTKSLILNHKIGKDTFKQRDSGLNHVLCKIARDNNITFLIDMDELNQEKQKDKKERAKILSRIIQNIKLIRKFKNKLKIINSKDKYSAFSFLITLGLPNNQAKEAIK